MNEAFAALMSLAVPKHERVWVVRTLTLVAVCAYWATLGRQSHAYRRRKAVDRRGFAENASARCGMNRTVYHNSEQPTVSRRAAARARRAKKARNPWYAERLFHEARGKSAGVI